MKTLWILAFLVSGVLLFPAFAPARIVENWQYDRLFKEADVVVIAVAGKTQPADDSPPKHEWPFEFVGQNTVFRVKHTLKGKTERNEIKMLHFKFGDKVRKGATINKEIIEIINGPLFVDFPAKSSAEYLLFLRKLKDGRYEPLSGRIDPALSVRKLSSSF